MFAALLRAPPLLAGGIDTGSGEVEGLVHAQVEERAQPESFSERGGSTHRENHEMKTKIVSNCARAGAVLSLALLSACATQKQYDAVAQDAKYYQTKLHEKELAVAKLQEENDRLKQQLKQSEMGALSEAGFGEDWQSRLSELQARIDGLNRPLNDVERFDVEGGYVLMVQDKILFEAGSADLNAEGKRQIVALAADIQSRPHGRIWVRGHTDSDPVSKPATVAKFPHGNLQLSAARAIEVGAELVGVGKVPSRDVAVVGFGPHDPLKSNNSAENKRLNRRVEIFVSDVNSSRPVEAGKSK